MDGGGVIDGAFGAVLEAHRDELNAAVADARRTTPDLDLAELGDVLATVVAPVVDAVDASGHGFADLVGRVLFDVALGLCAQHRLDATVRSGWTVVLPALAPHLAADPRRVVGAVTNALVRLDGTPGARPDEWQRRVAAAAPACTSTDDLLRAGQVAAWRAGMATFRDDALALAGTLPEPVLAAVLDVGPDGLARLAADPWFDPTPTTADDSGARTVAGAPGVGAPVRVGAFRGFGGTFLRPPVVVALDGRVVALDDATGEGWWVLADAFGSAVVRYGDDHGPPLPDLRRAVLGPGSTDPAPPPALAAVPEPTSWARTSAGIVATSARTHAVLFLRVPA